MQPPIADSHDVIAAPDLPVATSSLRYSPDATTRLPPSLSRASP